MPSGTRKLLRVGFSALLLATALAVRQTEGRQESPEASGRKREPERQEERLPPGAGYSLALEACVQCHDLRPVVSQRKTPAAWRRSVAEMIWRGAPVMPGEADILSRYLADSFGAEARPHSRSAARQRTAGGELSRFLPPGPGRGLVLAACVQCHDLMLTVSQRKSLAGWRRSVDRMAHLGARLNGSEIEGVAQYLARSFGPDDPIPEAIRRHPGFFTIEK